MNAKRARLILDCDPGVDDALALLAAVTFGELAGVTTVAGNSGVEVTTANAALACEVFGYRGAIVRGAARPLINEPAPASPAPPFSQFVDAGLELRGALSVVDRGDAAGFIVERSDASTWLVATGPLTNVALALRRDPGLAHRLAGISIMGGSATVGNVTPVAEFNFWTDPEAAHVVLTCGAPIRMCGLHVTHTVLATEPFGKAVHAVGTPCSSFVARLLRTYVETYPDAFVGQPVAPLHDPCAVLAVTDPHLFEWAPAHVAVELSGTLTRGMTVIDRRKSLSRQAPNVELAWAANSRAILERLTEAVGRSGAG